MPRFLQGKPTWMVVSFAALVLLCGFVSADILGRLVSYHSLTPPEKLSDTADSAPPQGQTDWGERRLASTPVAEAASATPSPSPDADADAVNDNEESPDQTLAAAVDTSENFPPVADATYYPEAETSNASENKEITLQGIMKGASTGIAVVEYKGDTYTVSPGDNVGSYQVTDIKANRVLFNKDGECSQVKMNTPPLESATASNAPAPTVGDYPPVLPAPNQVPLPPQPVTLPDTSHEIHSLTSSFSSSQAVYNITEADLQDNAGLTQPANELTREELDEFTRKGAALMADIRGSEVMNGRGVQIQFRNPDNALAKLGMRDGDIVISINSKNVYGMEDIYNAVLTMRDAPQIDIEVTRDGTPVSLFHKFPDRYE